MNYGQRIAQLRKNANLTQAQLGEKLNVSAQAVSKWENSQSEPDLTTIRKMCALFGISTDVFFEIEKQVENGDAKAFVSQDTYGVCVACGTLVTGDNLGQKSPKVMCSHCYTDYVNGILQLEEEKANAKKADKDKQESKKKHSIIFGVLAMVVVLAIGLSISIIYRHGSALAISICITLFFAYGAYALVSELFLDMGDAAWDIIEFSLESPIKLPMLIFDLDADSIIAFIFIKIGLSILGFIAGVALFLLGLLIGSIVSAFTFPFHMAKFNKLLKSND